MSLSTTARPYAQALFDHSDGWLEDLDQIVSAMSEDVIELLISSPEKAYKEKTEIFVDLFDGQVQQKTINFLKVLGEAKRLSLLPTISSEYKKLLAKKEAILLDPVYSGKAFAGLIGLIKNKKFTKNDNILFIHTGGAVSLSAYEWAF